MATYEYLTCILLIFLYFNQVLSLPLNTEVGTGPNSQENKALFNKNEAAVGTLQDSVKVILEYKSVNNMEDVNIPHKVIKRSKDVHSTEVIKGGDCPRGKVKFGKRCVRVD